MSVVMAGISTALPPGSMTQEEALRHALACCARNDRHARILKTLYEHTGIRTRHSVLLKAENPDPLRLSYFPPLTEQSNTHPSTAARMEIYEREVVPLATHAAAGALTDAQWSADSVTHLVTVSCTGFFAPGLDAALIQRLALRPSVQRLHVGFMGCHGALNGLQAAMAFAETRPGARVLLCAAELCSLHFQYDGPQDSMVANSLFADGAAAVALEHTDRDAPWRPTATGSCRLPDSEDAMSWRIGDRGFTMTLSSRVPDIIAANLPAWLDGWLGEQGMTRKDVRSWAIHPGGPRILQRVAASLELSDEDVATSRAVLSECGNMSSPTLLFILSRLRAAQAPRPCVCLGFGPGLMAEAALWL